MSAITIWVILLLSFSAVMFVAEVFVPSGGILGILATICLLVGLILCFVIDRWLGAGVSLAVVCLAPFALSAGVSVWQRTPIGKKMVLTTTAGEATLPQILIGSTGIAVTELRPMGECEFGESRIQAQSEMGQIIRPGTQVKVLSMTDGVVTVRELKA